MVWAHNLLFEVNNSGLLVYSSISELWSLYSRSLTLSHILTDSDSASLIFGIQLRPSGPTAMQGSLFKATKPVKPYFTAATIFVTFAWFIAIFLFRSPKLLLHLSLLTGLYSATIFFIISLVDVLKMVVGN